MPQRTRRCPDPGEGPSGGSPADAAEDAALGAGVRQVYEWKMLAASIRGEPRRHWKQVYEWKKSRKTTGKNMSGKR